MSCALLHGSSKPTIDTCVASDAAALLVLPLLLRGTLQIVVVPPAGVVEENNLA